MTRKTNKKKEENGELGERERRVLSQLLAKVTRQPVRTGGEILASSIDSTTASDHGRGARMLK